MQREAAFSRRRIGRLILLVRQFAPGRDLTIGLAVSILFHAGLFSFKGWGSQQRQPETDCAPPPALELIVMPTMEPEEPDIEEIETIRTVPMQASGAALPMQSDFPQAVPIDAFVQPVQLPQPRGARLSAPARIIHGGWGQGTDVEIFDPAALDQMAVPTLQLRPDYPEELRRNGIEGSALVEFIVDAAGRVRDPCCIAATNPDFAFAAITGVKKWRFRPGKKAGRAVNTRIRQMILFNLRGIEK